MMTRQPSRGGDPRIARRLFTTMSGALACLSFCGCATAGPYNPVSLGADQLGAVSEICRSTLGLRSSEPEGPVWGAEMNPGLTSGENHYEGCIASLSQTLRGMSTASTEVRAAQDCRERGLKSNTPALAECMLDVIDGPAAQGAATRETQVAAGTTDAAPRPFPGSFFNAPNGELRHREQLACARLSLTPGSAAFDDCVRN